MDTLRRSYFEGDYEFHPYEWYVYYREEWFINRYITGTLPSPSLARLETQVPPSWDALLFPIQRVAS